jgi:membrane-associated phospholipid phosphatase
VSKFALLNEMRVWEAATLLFFLYVGAVAASGNRPHATRARLYLGVAAGFLFMAVVVNIRYIPIVHDWLAPPVALLLGYWTSGLLFTGPRTDQERVLMALDRRLRILETARRLPTVFTASLEAAYAGVYVVVPVALILHLAFVPGASAEQFWSVVLLTDYVCFAVLPWVQTRPPRALEKSAPWNSPIRRFNIRMLGAASIKVNTFPSGHAAEALAAALLVIGAPPLIVAGLFLMALAISAGTVYGRYHYAADAFSGWLVALVVWIALR